MNDRREFLRVAALVPLATGADSSQASGATQTSDNPELVAVDGATAPPIKNKDIPDVPPIEEVPYSEYHLLGKPDPAANLFGGMRPQTWASAKSSLGIALGVAAQTGDPIHEWVKVFRDSFDVHTASIVLGAAAGLSGPSATGQLKYEPQLYEASLRSAAVLLDRCLQYRLAMNSYEQAGVSAGLSYLAFLKLRPLQRNFIVQSNLAALASIERHTEATAADKIHSVKGLVRLFEKYQLQARQIEAEGAAEQAGVAEAKDNFLTHLLEKQFHLQVDAQLAMFTKLLTPGSASNYAERYLRTLTLLTEDLTDAYRKIFSAAIGVQQVVGLRKISVAAQASVDVSIPAFTSSDVLSKWIAQIIPTQAVDQRNPNVLDALVLWTRAVIRELDVQGQTESEFAVSIPLNQPWGKQKAALVSAANMTAAFQSASATGKVSFTLDSSDVPVALALKNVRVTGVGVSVERSADDASPLQFTSGFPHTPANLVVAVGQKPQDNPEPTPQQIAAAQAFELAKMARLNVTVVTPAQTAPGGKPYARPAIFLPNVRIQGGSGGDAEGILSYDPACRGLNPFGIWSLSVDPNVVAYFQSNALILDNWITGIVLHLRLRASMI